jgi:hypothetical protein
MFVNRPKFCACFSLKTNSLLRRCAFPLSKEKGQGSKFSTFIYDQHIDIEFMDAFPFLDLGS